VGLAATIGREFTLDLLTELSDGDVDSLVPALDDSSRRRIVCEHWNAAYDFTHDKIHEVAYAELSGARRCMLHRRAAQALKRLHATNLRASRDCWKVEGALLTAVNAD
jgi:predicted ATPase